MKTLNLEITLISNALTGSGENFGAIVDTDIVFDDIGLPYIPAKRIKGCLRDSAEEVMEMFGRAKMKLKNGNSFEKKEIVKTFGESGSKCSCPVYFSNLMIENYEENKKWLKYLSIEYKKEYKNLLSKDVITDAFTELRQQTSIDKEGVARKHSLRTIRVIRRGHKFCGEIQVEDESVKDILVLACMNLRHIGTKRNRGYGEVKCRLFHNDKEITVKERVEELCEN